MFLPRLSLTLPLRYWTNCHHYAPPWSTLVPNIREIFYISRYKCFLGQYFPQIEVCPQSRSMGWTSLTVRKGDWKTQTQRDSRDRRNRFFSLPSLWLYQWPVQDMNIVLPVSPTEKSCIFTEDWLFLSLTDWTDIPQSLVTLCSLQ